MYMPRKHIIMKKFFNRVWLYSMVLTVAAGMNACSSSDDEPENGGEGLGEVPALPTPEYESSSAKYEITQSSSSISSIELTASGEYIVTERQGYFASPAKASVGVANHVFMMFNSPSVSVSRASGSGIIAGKFVKISDTEYILEGYGSIVIEGDSDNAFSLQITPADGETTTVAAKKASSFADSQINNALCRTWNVNTIGARLAINNDTYFKKDRPASQLDMLMAEAQEATKKYFMSHFGAEADEFDPYEPIGYYPTEIIMTKAGTYMVKYSNNGLAVATWHWIDEAKGQFQFSWDYDNPDSTASGVGGATNYVSFKGNELTINERHVTKEDDVRFVTESLYGCTMAK